LKGKRLWACFGDFKWGRVEDIFIRSWLGDECRRLRANAEDITREQSCGIFQDAMRNFVRWVDRVKGIEVWTPPEIALPACDAAIPF
jgi:hypothetical protein